MKANIEERNKKIVEEYRRLVSTKVSQTSAIETLSKDNELSVLYVKSILKVNGVRVARKGKYSKRKVKTSGRDKQIMEMAERGDTPEIISGTFGITPTRVRQVIRANVTDLKQVKLEQVLAAIKNDVYKNVPYEDIIARYGTKAIKDVKANFGYNLFKAYKAQRDAQIVKMAKRGKPAAEIGEKYGLCRDYVYSICHERGIAMGTRQDLTPEQRARRDRKIYAEATDKDVKLKALAKKYKLSYTMIKIIFDQQEKLNRQKSENGE